MGGKESPQASSLFSELAHFGILGCKYEYEKVLALNVFIIELKKKKQSSRKGDKGYEQTT